jgi:hypothetical protein
MCVYCKDALGCDHERDACAASLGEYCAKCGHGSAAILSYTPGPRWAFSWFPPVNPRKRAAEEGSSNAMGESAGQK